jgi:Zn finger protein HypA/HybF involved in hydrogenase expression
VALVPLLDHSRSVVRKRTITAIGNLACIAFVNVLKNLVDSLLNNLQEQETKKDYLKIQTIITTFATLSKSNLKHVEMHMDLICKYTISFCELKDDDLKEVCLSALETFALYCPQTFESFAHVVVNGIFNR